MKLGIYTLDKTLFDGEVSEIIAKTTTGEISVLKNHIPLITRLVKGPFRMKDSAGVETSLDIDPGVLDIRPENIIVVLIDPK